MSNGVIDAYYPSGIAEYFLLSVGRRFSNSGIRHLATGSSAGPFTDVESDLPTSVQVKGAGQIGSFVFVCDRASNKVYRAAANALPSWTELATPLSSNDAGMAVGNNILVVGNSSGDVAYSLDGGDSWATVSLGHPLTALAFGGGTFVGVGYDGPGDGPMFSWSNDGTGWTPAPMDVGGTWTPVAAAFSGTYWVIASANFCELYRTINLTAFAKVLNAGDIFPASGSFNASIASDGEGTVLVIGNNGADPAQVAVSVDDGGSWVEGDSTGAVASPNVVAWGDGKFHTLGHMSDDGDPWVAKDQFGTTDFWDRMTALIEVWL